MFVARPSRRFRSITSVVVAGLCMLAAQEAAASQPTAAASPPSAEAPEQPAKAAAAEKKTDEKKGATEPNYRDTKLGGKGRVLNKHYFITPLYASPVMLNSSFAFSQGGGAFLFKLPQTETGPARTARVFFYYQDLQGQIAIKNRVSIDLAANGLAAVGGSLPDIIDIGALANVTAGGGIRARLYTWEKIGLQLTAGLQTRYYRTLGVQPSALIGQAVEAVTGEQSEAIESQLISQSQDVEVSPMVMLAYGNGPFGLQASFGGVASVPLKRPGEKTQGGINAGVHAAFDAGHYTKYFPMALTAEYQVTQDFPASEENVASHNLAFGFLYNGRRDVTFGPLFGVQIPGDSQKLLFGALTLQYFF